MRRRAKKKPVPWVEPAYGDLWLPGCVSHVVAVEAMRAAEAALLTAEVRRMQEPLEVQRWRHRKRSTPLVRYCAE